MLSSFGERSNAHHNSAKAYASIERRIHECITYKQFKQETIQDLRQALDRAAQGSPAVARRLWNKVPSAKKAQEKIDHIESTIDVQDQREPTQ